MDEPLEVLDATFPRMDDLGFRRKGRVFRVDIDANREGVVRLRTAQAADGALRVGELISVCTCRSSSGVRSTPGTGLTPPSSCKV